MNLRGAGVEEGRRTLAARWRALERCDPALAAAAAGILAEFLDGGNPPRSLPDDCDLPGRPGWPWLADNGMVTRWFIAPVQPVVQAGPHVYGHRGFSGYRVAPEAREVFRYLFGAGVWLEK